MKKNYSHIIVLSLVFLAASCSKKTHDRVVEPTKTATTLNEEFEMGNIDTSMLNEEVIPIEQQKFVVVGILKEACFGGGCPVYEFSLQNDGIAFYQCKSGCSPRKGSYYAYIGREKANELLEFVKMNSMVQLNSVYPLNGRPVPHIPLTQFTVSIDDHRTKKIRSYHHSPEILVELEQLINEIIERTDWEPSYE